ncbi:MAG TPA: RidA family protein [Bauldia sp.]|nr:RidA family protein [Bauldia sp.]
MREPKNALVHEVLQPEGWPQPRGYANGVAARGRTIYTGGLIGWDAKGGLADDFLGQVRQTLHNTLTVLRTGGAGPEHIARMTWYVTNIETYLAAQKEVGAAYREALGRAFPAMALVEVVRLVEPKAQVEIETIAVVPD